MDLGLLTHLVVLLFAVLVVLGALAFLVLDTFSRVDYLNQKAPWLQRIAERRGAIGVLLLVAVLLVVGDGYELVAKDFPESKTPQLIFPAPSAPKIVIEKRIIKTTGSGRLDRDLNDQQSDHLYHRLKSYVDLPNRVRPATVLLVNAYPCDREAQHIFWRLSKIFTDAQWTITQEGGWPIKSVQLQGRTRNEIPIGIWILTDDTYLRYFVWNSFQESGLGADDRFGNELPDQFKGLIVIVGYKDAPM